MIDVEFYGDEFVRVRDAWRSYLDQLSNKPPGDLTLWVSKNEDLFVELLKAMAIVLRYRFDEVTLKKGAYSPIAHSVVDEEEAKLRSGLLKVLEGNASVKIEPVPPPPPPPSDPKLPRR